MRGAGRLCQLILAPTQRRIFSSSGDWLLGTSYKSHGQMEVVRTGSRVGTDADHLYGCVSFFLSPRAILAICETATTIQNQHAFHFRRLSWNWAGQSQNDEDQPKKKRKGNNRPVVTGGHFDRVIMSYMCQSRRMRSWGFLGRLWDEAFFV